MSSSRGGIESKFDLGKYIIVKIKRGSKHFEMIADPKPAWKAKKALNSFRAKEKKDEPVSVEDVLKIDEIDLADIFQTFDVFENVKKAVVPTEQELLDAFETTEGKLLAAHFVLEGDFAWTQEQRKEWVIKKKKQIVNIIARNSVNPQNKKPHPPARIEKAMEEVRVQIDINKTAEEQVDDVIKLIKVILPIKIESISMAVKVPSQYAAKAYNVVAQYAQIKKSEWQNDGSWIGMISLPAGLQMEMLDKLNKLTHGRMESKIMDK